jgi:hypothetical protein
MGAGRYGALLINDKIRVAPESELAPYLSINEKREWLEIGFFCDDEIYFRPRNEYKAGSIYYHTYK